jgi:AAA domain
MPVQSSLPSLFFADEAKRDWPTIFLYAIAGAGKTNALRTLAHLNPLVLGTEIGNTKGMSTLGDLHIATIPLDNLDQLVMVTTELSAKAKPGELYYGGLGPFGCLALDSLTGVGTFLEGAIKQLRGWDLIWMPEAKHDPRSAYPYINEKGRQVVAKLMALPVPLVLTCREQLITEGEGAASKTYAVPELPGQKLPRELPGWPEASVRLRMVNGHRVIVTENEGDVISRIRLKPGLRLSKYIRPDLGALIRLLQGDETALKDLEIVPQAAKQTPQQLQAELRRQELATQSAKQASTASVQLASSSTATQKP